MTKDSTPKTVIPVTYEETIFLKDLRNNPITFQDYKNSSDFDISKLNGNVFVIGNLNTFHLENILSLKKDNPHIKFHFFDTKHSQKNYAEILIATFTGEILQTCGSFKEINFISQNKGFQSINHF